MLLTIFSNPKTYEGMLSDLARFVVKKSDFYFQVAFDVSATSRPILTGTIFEVDNRTFLVFDTYNLLLSKDHARKLDSEFEIYRVANDEFARIFKRSNQVVECEYLYKKVERKATAFDLKGLESFLQRLKESTILSLTLSLQGFDVIITLREEGRLSISPDIESETLVKIVRSLFGNNIRSVIT